MNKFYFYIGYSLEDKCIIVAICPKEYFDTYNCSIDYYFEIEQLPQYIKYIGDGLFSTSNNVDTTRNDLIKLGFISDNKFSEFCKNHNPFINEFTPLLQNLLDVEDEIKELFANKENLTNQFGYLAYQYFINTDMLSKYNWSATLNYEGRCIISLDVPLKEAEDLFEIFQNFQYESPIFHLDNEIYLSIHDNDLDISFPNLNSLLANIKLLNIKVNFPDYSEQIRKLSDQIDSLKQHQDYYNKIRDDQNKN